MAKYDNQVVRPSTPRMGNAVTRWIGEVILWMIGWKIIGQLPDEKKVIVIGAPHTSNLDFVIAMGSMLSVGLRFSYMMKKEAFFWPVGWLWKKLGGIPIDRSKKNDVTQQMTDWFDANDNVMLGITPEGTRKKVDKFKKGYLRMAYAANVPVFIIGLRGHDKTVVLDKIFELSGDIDKDNAMIKSYVNANFDGVNPKNA